MNPYVFFVGCPRSGTTLLRRMADAHPKLAVLGELHWLPRWWQRRVGTTPEGTVTAELVDALVAEPRFHKLNLEPSAVAGLLEDGRPKHYAEFVTELFDLHGETRGKRLVGEKTPGYVRFLPILHSLWPQARFVHLVRDGRDVALSLFDRTRTYRRAWRLPTWDEDPATTAALFWEWNVRLGREAGARIGRDRYFEVRYEALVADPELECRRLCDFLALSFEPSMLRFHEGRRRAEPGLSPKSAWQPITPGLRSWREQMTPVDLVRFEAVARELLSELGYELAAESASSADLATAARLRGVFVDGARARRRPIPTVWESEAA